MSSKIKIFEIGLILLSLSLGARAQETTLNEEHTPPPVAGITVADSDSSDDVGRPDTRPVTGYLPLTVGTFGTERSFLAPSFRFSQTVDSNPGIVGGQSEPVAATDLSANVSLQQVWRQSQFSLNYTAGGLIYASQSNLNSAFQMAHLQQAFESRRWSLTLADDVTYAPESAFGFSGFSGTGISSSASISPNQTILTNQTEQITNNLIGQVSYYLDRRSSITLGGTFGLQRFPSSSLFDSDQGGFLVGYNYSLDPRDSLGVSYSLYLIRYPGTMSSENLDSHNIQLAYGRRITGRLALRISAGPQINQNGGTALSSADHVAWTANSSLTYRLRRAELQVSYGHSVNAGAGVLALSKTDQFEGILTSRLTRTLSGSLHAGYAHNINPQQVGGSPGVAFNTEFMEARLQRPLGHEGVGFLTYTFQHQSSNVVQCSLGVCGKLDRHIGGVGFEWHMRPLLIR